MMHQFARLPRQCVKLHTNNASVVKLMVRLAFFLIGNLGFEVNDVYQNIKNVKKLKKICFKGNITLK
jgi:hypothetical protein